MRCTNIVNNKYVLLKLCKKEHKEKGNEVEILINEKVERDLRVTRMLQT